MDFFSTMEVSASGLAVERARMNVASANLANASTTRSAEGGPYKRRDVVVAADEYEAHVARIQEDTKPPRLEYDPGHPDANADGYVAYPNVNPVEEMVDMITASRAYEAGVTAIGTATQMAERALAIGK
jgi:flagellar basal-body rod protein FlgC